MKNCRKSIFFLFLILVFQTLSISAYAYTRDVKEDDTEDKDIAAQVAADSQAIKEAVTTTASAIAAAASPQSVSAPVPVPAGAAAQTQEATKTETSVEAPQKEAVPQPSGVVEISGYKYPVSLYVPQDYKVDRVYPMIMIAPSGSMKGQAQIDYLSGLAQRRNIFVLATSGLGPKGGDTPYELDSWLLSVKKDVMERFPINKKRVYLLGKDASAHYAAYLGIQYPQEFSAVALLGEAWDGSFDKLIKGRTSKEDQLPFYIAFKAGTDNQSRNEAWLGKLQGQGYLLRVMEYQKDEDLNALEFKTAMFDWLEEKSQSWAAAVADSQKGWKKQFKKGVKDFFTV